MQGTRDGRSTESIASPRLTLRPLSPALGVEVLDLAVADAVDDGTFAALRAAWLEHCVLLFRNQTLDDLAQVRFAERFGPLATTQAKYQSGWVHPAIMYVTNEKKDGQYTGALPDGEMYFHSDRCYLERPSMATLLYAIAVPSQGGETLLANMYAAYDALSDEWKARLTGLQAVNVYDPGSGYMVRSTPRPPRSANARWCAHPIVRTHPETGRRSLFVNRLMSEEIVGVPQEESERILTFLFDHQEQPRFVYEHGWRPGDLIIWDNRCTLHARRDFSHLELRKLRRVAVEGDRPV